MKFIAAALGAVLITTPALAGYRVYSSFGPCTGEGEFVMFDDGYMWQGERCYLEQPWREDVAGVLHGVMQSCDFNDIDEANPNISAERLPDGRLLINSSGGEVMNWPCPPLTMIAPQEKPQ